MSVKNKTQIFISILTLFLFQINIVSGQSDTTEIIILHTNDMHAKIDNMAKLAHHVNQYKNKHDNVFLFSAGDNFTGNPIVDRYKEPGYPMIDLMNKIHFDLSCIGNHEFDYGQKNLNRNRNQANFPFISANIFSKNDAELVRPKAYSKFITKNGISIGVLGLTQINKHGIPDSSPLKLKNLSFNNPIETAKKYKNYKDSFDIFIALSHLGYKTDSKLAKKVPIFDVIIGGHSHTKLPEGKLTGSTLITQSGSSADYLGVTTLKIVNRKLISKKDTMLTLKKLNGYDKKISDLVNRYNNNPALNKVIGQAKNDITGKKELGAMVTDAMRDFLKVDVAFQNNGGIRVPQIQKGDITIKQVLELSPFGNTLVEYNLTPKQIKKLIKYAYNLNKETELQVSGLIINLLIADDKKLKKIELFTSDKKDLNKKTYSVVINNYMAAAYNLKFLKNGKEHSVIDAESIIHFIKKSKNINYKGVKRVFENMK